MNHQRTPRPPREKRRKRNTEISISKPHYLEIMAPGISTGAALRLLLRHLGLNASEVMAIGDGPNDLDMLRTAGIGVAVGNAPPEVLAGVKYIVSSSDRDGVAEAVERYILQPINLRAKRGW